MTHGGGDGSNTDVDEHLIYEGPHGIHFDSLEGKWVAAAALVGIVMVLSGSMELLALFGPVALGVRGTKRIPKLAQLEPQPWWACGGLLLGISLGTGIRLGLVHLFGITTPDIPWQRALDMVLQVIEAAA